MQPAKGEITVLLAKWKDGEPGAFDHLIISSPSLWWDHREIFRREEQYAATHDDLAARQEDLKTADGWVDKTLSTKKAKAEKQPGTQGITMDQPK